MQTASLVFGILAIVGMLVGFIPCLGAINWINIPLSGIGLIISFIALARSEKGKKGCSIAGIVGCGIAVTFGFIRLVLGGGIL